MKFSFFHSCSDGVKIKETQSPALVGERPRGGGNGSRAKKLANPSEVALMCVLLVRPIHPSATSGGPTPSTGTPTSRSQPKWATVNQLRRPICPLFPSSNLCTSHFTMSGRGLIVAGLNLRHSAELATITFSIPPVVCATPQNSRRSRSRYLPSSAPLRRARDDHVLDTSRRLRHSAELATIMFTMESTMGSTSRDLRSAIQPMWFDLSGTSCAKSCSAAKSPGTCSEEGPPNPQCPYQNAIAPGWARRNHPWWKLEGRTTWCCCASSWSQTHRRVRDVPRTTKRGTQTSLPRWNASQWNGLPDRSTKILRPMRTPRSSPLPISSSREVPPNQSLPSPSISPCTDRWCSRWIQSVSSPDPPRTRPGPAASNISAK